MLNFPADGRSDAKRCVGAGAKKDQLSDPILTSPNTEIFLMLNLCDTV
jgi:hypothetical protein